jgi:hypothetical protein
MTVDYSQLSTDELLQRFVDTAKRAGTIYSLDRDKLRNAAQRKVLVPQMQALGAELRKRNPTERLRQLFDDEDRDVRGWAGPQFLSVDPDWAHATTLGLNCGLTTREVLAWQERISRGAPPKPTLQEMTVPQLLDRFVDACERCHGTTQFLSDEETGGPDVKAYNKASGEIYRVAKELNDRGELAALVPLMDHSFITVREKAALNCLDIASEKAVVTLEAVGESGSPKEAVEASLMLRFWRWGDYHPFSD